MTEPGSSETDENQDPTQGQPETAVRGADDLFVADHILVQHGMALHCSVDAANHQRASIWENQSHARLAREPRASGSSRLYWISARSPCARSDARLLATSAAQVAIFE